MPHRLATRRYWFAVLTTFVAAGSASAAERTPAAHPAAERGFPLIQTITPSLDEASTQNFGITRDPTGVLYVANLSGVLTYDGAWWRLIPIGKQKSAFAIAVDAAGRVGVGGVDELGYLRANAHGALEFVSLIALLPPDQRDPGQVMQVQPYGKGFLYLTTRWLFAWDGESIAAVATFPGDRPYTTISPVADAVYVWTRDGLFRLAGHRLEAVAGGDAFRGRRIDLLLPGTDASNLLISVRGEGLFRFAGGRATPFAPEASRWAVGARLYSGTRLDDGRWALGSVTAGLLLLRPDGSVEQRIDAGVGLPDDFVGGAVVDREGALWLALNNGLARLQVASSLSLIDLRCGLKGSVYAVTRHLGTLWVGTSTGLYTTDTAVATPGADDWGRPTRMRVEKSVPPSVWSLLSTGDELLAGSAFGVFVSGGSGFAAIAEAGQRTSYTLRRSLRDPRRVWVGFEEGLGAIYREPGGWRYEGMVPGAAHEVRSIAESSTGTVWCGTPDGLLEVSRGSSGSGAATDFASLRGRLIGTEAVGVFSVGARLLVTRDGKVLELDERDGTLTATPALAVLDNGSAADALVEDAAGNLWLNGTPPARAPRVGDHWASPRALVELPARDAEVVVPDADAVVWLGTEHGLARYAGAARDDNPPLLAPLLSRVALDGDSTLFGGAPGRTAAPVELGPEARRLRVEFAPLSFRAGLRYQTRLDPLDRAWSRAGESPVADFTRPPADRYVFRVRTVGAGGELSPETTWEFRVRPPWYLTPAAFTGWALVLLLAIYGYGRLRHRALRRRAAALEERVAEQTVVLRRTVAELEVANGKLEELSLSDELTGIANRRRFQQTLDEEWSRARRHGLPIALAILDLDDFKLLNDTRGHLEGDHCLKAVARYLADAVQRRGDLVARWGGEEFAVLLPNTDLGGATTVAEQQRAGIEALGIAHPAVVGGCLTASVGVAALTPLPAEEVAVLVEAADQALYRAKNGGRNRVRVTAAGSGPAAQPGSAAGDSIS